ncbi:uncharacterized protein PAC_05719 [Phialocephala subalpina]|uniref:Sporulation-specific protein 2 n=1 Tax=Phialocephala subalpina TaxID=576137 RepID=A0A1L7WST2_9HELO|nr:uncharacterized protein PAC_05719 [Phialocephala subalpina]
MWSTRIQLVALVLGARGENTCPGDTNNALNITSQTDADGLSSNGCTTVGGNVFISGDDITSRTLSDIETIIGDLTVSNAPNLVSLSAKSISSISGHFSLINPPKFQSFDLPALQTAGGIDWEILPACGEMAINLGGKVGNVIIANTTIGDNLILGITKADAVNITTNPKFDYITMNSLTTVSNAPPNSPNVNMQALTAGNVTIRDVESLNIPALERVTAGDMIIADNTFTTLSAPKLQTIVGSLAITNNTFVYQVDMLSLTSIGFGNEDADKKVQFTVADNEALKQMHNLGGLISVYGDISISGPLNSVNLLGMKAFNGNVAINTSLAGDTIDHAKHSKTYSVHLTGWKSGVVIGVIALAVLIFFGLAFFCWRRRTNMRRGAAASATGRGIDSMPPDSGGPPVVYGFSMAPTGYKEVPLDQDHELDSVTWSADHIGNPAWPSEQHRGFEEDPLNEHHPTQARHFT